MAFSKGTSRATSFVRGLITETTELSFPENAAASVDNCILDPKGNILRRLGLSIDDLDVLEDLPIDESLIGKQAVVTHTWTNVNNVGSARINVIQIGATLYFKDLSNNTLLATTIDLNTYAKPSGTPETERVSVASGKGALFVSSNEIDPIYLISDGITVTANLIKIKVRDFEGIDDSLDVDEQPAVLSNEHKYNLFNQGWRHPNKNGVVAEDQYITEFDTDTGTYPSNVMQWPVGKDENNELNLLTDQITTFNWGTTPAPKGSYILDAFNKDRSAVSGIGAFPVETKDYRPRDVEFHAGRAWYTTDEGNMFFSQLIRDNFDNVGLCYQSADPTAEDDNLLVDTDGGIISIQGAGLIYGTKSSGSNLLVFAENGVWTIRSVDGGFQATSFSVDRVTTSGAIGTFSIVLAEGTPVYWSDEGIYGLSADSVSGRLQAQSLTNDTIKTFYNAIPDADQGDATGIYDKASKKITWFYRDSSATFTNKYVFNRNLTLDVVSGAFTPSSTVRTLSTTPYIVGAYDTFSTVDNLRGGHTRLKYLTIIPETQQFGFATFSSKDFLDFETEDYRSFLLTGYDTQQQAELQKQAPYITMFSKRTEDGVVMTENGFELSNQSSIKLSTRWDFASTDESGKFSKRQQAYRFRRNYTIDPNVSTFDNGYDVVVTRNKILGRGRSLQILLESDTGKDFNIIGWSTTLTGNTEL